jgi:hypothetical protein
MARGRLFGIVQAGVSLVCVAAGSHSASAQSVFNLTGTSQINVLGITVSTPPKGTSKGATVLLPGIAVGGLVSIDPASLNLNGKGAIVITPGANIAGLARISSGSVGVSGGGAVVVTPGVSIANVATVTSATVSASASGVAVVTPGISVAGVASVGQATVGLSGAGATVALPTVNALGISVAATPLNVNLSGGPLLELPAVSVGAGSISLNLPGGGLGDIINQTNSTTQMFSNIGSAQAMAPVEQMLNGFAFGDDPSAGGCAAASAMTQLAGTKVWMWNASTVQSMTHEGYRIRSSDGNDCGSSTSMPVQTQETAQLPGFMFDASSAFGLAPGSFRVGFSGGTTETEKQVKASAALRDAGINQASTLQLKSWSLGTFSLLTGKNWYAGSAIGATWGEADSMNFVTGSASDYSTTGLVAAGFVGTIVPLNETTRFDVRATLSHQRTVGQSHTDSLGVVYGDHTLQSTDASLSARLFGVFRDGDLTIRPFVQAGVIHHLAYDNALTIDGIGYQLLEADTTVFTAAGVDFELARALQFSLGVRHETNSDLESWAGRVGFTYRFN